MVHKGQSNSYETGQRFVISLPRDGPLLPVSRLPALTIHSSLGSI